MERGVVRIERRILSPTAINTYLSCPRKYYLRYIRKLRTKPSIHLIRGNLIHKTIQAFHRDCSRGPTSSSENEISESLLKTFNRLWVESQKDLDALGLPQAELDEYHVDSEQMLLNYAGWFTRQDTPPLVNYSEVRIFSDYLGVMGIIDAVRINGNEVTLIDYKTSKNPMVTDEIMRQAVLYALLYRDRYNKAPDVVCIHFLKNPGDPIDIHIDELFLEYAEILLESVREKTRANDEHSYPCTCGGYCERDFSN
jgi:CRISPR/Cas system-associated exonuclease Cas4 (RecB family)